MVVCPKCGTQNPLGRVFCISCGTRLDLSQMSSSQIDTMQKPKWTRHFRASRIVAVLVILVLALVGLAAWPKTGQFGTMGTPSDGKRLQAQLNSLRLLRDGQTLGVTLTEMDINSHLRFFKLKRLNVDAFYVGLESGYAFVRIVRDLGKIGVASYSVNPKLSMDLVCMPVGPRLVVRKATLGHLQLVGPARTMAVRRLYRMLGEEPEWGLLKDVDEVNVEEGRIELVVKK